MREFIHNIARHYNIPREEYESLLPEVPDPVITASGPGFESPKNTTNAGAAIPLGAGYEPQEEQRSPIPPEYRHDPDLWQAIKASMQDQGDVPRNADLAHIQDTGSTADCNAEIGNESFETAKANYGGFGGNEPK